MTHILPTKSVKAANVDVDTLVSHQGDRWIVDEVSKTRSGLVLWLVPADGRTTRRSRLEAKPDAAVSLEGDQGVQQACLQQMEDGMAKVRRTGPLSILFEFDHDWTFELSVAPADPQVPAEEEAPLASVPDLMDALEGSVDAAREADTVASDE